jgi:hypothetical protein
VQNIRPYALIATFFIAACQMNKELQSPHHQDGLYTWMEEISPTKTALDEGNNCILPILGKH